MVACISDRSQLATFPTVERHRARAALTRLGCRDTCRRTAAPALKDTRVSSYLKAWGFECPDASFSEESHWYYSLLSARSGIVDARVIWDGGLPRGMVLMTSVLHAKRQGASVLWEWNSGFAGSSDVPGSTASPAVTVSARVAETVSGNPQRPALRFQLYHLALPSRSRCSVPEDSRWRSAGREG